MQESLPQQQVSSRPNRGVRTSPPEAHTPVAHRPLAPRPFAPRPLAPPPKVRAPHVRGSARGLFSSVYDDGRTRIDQHGLRTVRIRGQVTPARRRPSVTAQTYGASPDRAVMWAVVMGVFMVFVALFTGGST